jgi:hypothetical protein
MKVAIKTRQRLIVVHSPAYDGLEKATCSTKKYGTNNPILLLNFYYDCFFSSGGIELTTSYQMVEDNRVCVDNVVGRSLGSK